MQKTVSGRAPGFLLFFVIGAAILAQPARADFHWNAWVGAQSHDLGRQALAFLPNEIWIHEGDSVVWHFGVDEIHTVTFLTAGQVRPPFPAGCMGFSTSPATFTGATCVTTPPLTKPATFTVQFTVAGNYKAVCLVHPDMTGTVHVLPGTAALPHEQPFYDAQADEQAEHLLAEADHDGHHAHGGWHAGHAGAVGDGEVSSNAGGKSTSALRRFTDGEMTIHAGDRVEWDNQDPSTPHRITFGREPADPMPPSLNVSTDADGARHATLNAPGDSAHS